MSAAFTFSSLPAYLVKALTEIGITEPTDIQAKMIPEAIDGQSLIARSQTGTGKTLAYLLPGLMKVDPNKKGLQMIVLAPTQELAMQVVEVAKQLTKEEALEIGSFIGGANIKRQLEKLKKQKPQIAIGTPGRILELIELKKLKVHEVNVVAVDEADRMIAEASSWDATLEIAKRAGRETQYLFVSATIPANFREMLGNVVPFVDEVEAEGGLLAPAIEHLFMRVDYRDKVDMTRKLIHAEKIEKGIVFVNQLERLQETVEKLVYKGVKAQALSSDQSKLERERALNGLKKGDIHILIATDVAARGLDIDDVTHIIQIDPPAEPNSYLHRAGRTGRMNKSGTVITLIDPKSEYKLDKYQRDLGIVFKECTLTHGMLKLKEQKETK